MLHKMRCSSLTVRVLPRQVGKEVQRFFSKERESTKALLLRGKDVKNAFILDKWNKSSDKGRLLRTLNQRHFSQINSTSTALQEFTDTFPEIIYDLVDDPKFGDIAESVSSIKDMLDYTVPTGKRNRAMSLLHCYKHLEDPKRMTPENMKLVNILGWCLETMQGALIIADDMRDDADVRRGRKCWHKLDGVGTRAVMDMMLLEYYTYELINKHFTHLPMYLPVMYLFQDAFMAVGLGEILDGMPMDVNKDLTRQRFETLVKYKTTSNTVELPYALARCATNNFHTEIPPHVQEIIKLLGEFYQIQNDFMDCYDDVSYKTANDIEEGKCSWLVVVALEKANAEQRRLIQTHYGKKSPESVKIVKDLYDTLEIPKAYAKCEKDTYDFIEKNIDEVTKVACHEMLFKPLDKLYQPYL